MPRGQVAKLSTKTVMGKLLPEIINTLPEDGATVWLYDVFGVARAVRSGESNYGPWNSFLGACVARRLKDGAKMPGDECFLPGMAEGRVLAFMKQVQASGGGEVEYAFRIGIKKGDTQKYNYVIEKILDEGASDPIAALEKRMDAALAIEDKTSSAEAGKKKVSA